MFQAPFVNIIDPTASKLRAVDNGFIFLGKEDTDPTIPANQIPVYYTDENGTTKQLSQPIQLNDTGVPVLSKSSGTIINPVFYADIVSIVIKKKGDNGKTVYSNESYPALNDYFTHLFSAIGFSYQGQWMPNIQIPAKADRVDNYALWEPSGGKIIIVNPDDRSLDSGFTTSATFAEDLAAGRFLEESVITLDKKYNVNGKLPRSLMSRADDVNSVRDFIYDETDYGINVNKSLDYSRLNQNNKSHGGTTELDRGVLNVKSQITLVTGDVDQTDGLSLVGKGVVSTVLDAPDPLPSNSSVITDKSTGGYSLQHARMTDFSVFGGSYGIELVSSSRFHMRSVNASKASKSGFYLGNVWNATYDSLFADSNEESGIVFDYKLQKTSTSVIGGYALLNKNHGWEWGMMNYSHASAVASDRNTNHGHLIRNSKGFTMTSCGAEDNGRASFAAIASASEGSNENVTIQGAFTVNGDKSGGGWGSLCHLVSTDGTKNEITLRDSYSLINDGNTAADVVVDGEGSYLTLDNCYLENGWLVRNGGYVNYRHTRTLLVDANFGAGAAREICALRSTQWYVDTYGGTITIHVSNIDTSTGKKRTGTYYLLVNKQLDEKRTVVEIAKAGEVDGLTSNSAPSFTWSINEADKLVAAGVNSNIAGDFYFEIDTDSQVIAVNI